MSTSFITALQTNDNLTANGMPTHSTSGKECVNLFFDIGSLRNNSEEVIIQRFAKAYHEDKSIATKMLFWARDARGGAGERRTFRIVMKWLASNHPDTVLKTLWAIPVFGRWDDVYQLVGLDPKLDSLIKDFITDALALPQYQGLAAKWLPREKSKQKDIAWKLIRLLGLNPKQYRQTIAGLTNVVETQMCRNEWGAIKFEHVPAGPTHKYRKAFPRRASEEFGKFMERVKSGEVKMKADTLFPYQIVRSCKGMLRQSGQSRATNGNIVDSYVIGNSINKSEREVLDAQWKALPNYLKNSAKRMIPVVDVSGSMCNGQVIAPIDISVSLGIYLSERNVGAFKDYFITFSGKPSLVKVIGDDILEKVRFVNSAEWGQNTDLEATFRMILKHAVANNVPANEMPNSLVIISDMEFDRCVANGDSNAWKMISDMYSQAGYEIPEIVFWKANVLNGNNNAPVKHNQIGAALVSGASPAIVESVLSGDLTSLTPEAVMMATLNKERYADIVLN